MLEQYNFSHFPLVGVRDFKSLLWKWFTIVSFLWQKKHHEKESIFVKKLLSYSLAKWITTILCELILKNSKESKVFFFFFYRKTVIRIIRLSINTPPPPFLQSLKSFYRGHKEGSEEPLTSHSPRRSFMPHCISCCDIFSCLAPYFFHLPHLPFPHFPI